MPNYQESKIYKIYNTVNDDIYIGSTTRKLCERMSEHRRRTNSRYTRFPIYKAFGEHGVDNFFIELVEKCPCNDKDELRKKEGEYIRELKPSLNTQMAGRTKKEYHKEYYKEHLSQFMKSYNENNKEQIKAHKGEHIACECGCVMNRSSMLRHQRSKKHNELINNITR